MWKQDSSDTSQAFYPSVKYITWHIAGAYNHIFKVTLHDTQWKIIYWKLTWKYIRISQVIKIISGYMDETKNG